MSELVKQVLSYIPGGSIGDVVKYILSHFGAIGLAAAFILGTTIATVIFMKLLKVAFDVLRFVAIPSLVVTFLASCFLPYPFSAILPIAVVFFSVLLIVRA